MRSVIAYTASRLLLFAVAFGLLYLLGARGFLAIALAFLLSGLVSYILLNAQRDAMSEVVAGWMTRMRGMGAQLEAGAAKEDEFQVAGREAADRAEGVTPVEENAAAPAAGAAGGEERDERRG
ncbi:DUF4229 domain-containing protein [Marinactinospora thermotolerans]|uniref:DUF4229 domain-containing protein n=1 Tax=Marinactinospora thermotolerans DSM 45154 TaxID=1122192 RepID=A0A1T4SSS1_9ACTN|nr:DUF4229 domain-containing protein [Marinactinospora thermotolerans]SKA31279.1 Protein of unknown function [Marinactinospora thermotolerans DSM 45154]